MRSPTQEELNAVVDDLITICDIKLYRKSGHVWYQTPAPRDEIAEIVQGLWAGRIKINFH